MESFLQIPWSLLIYSTEIILGGFFGVALLLVKFPAARYLGKILLSYALLLLTGINPDLPFNQSQVLIVAIVCVFLYSQTFFSQKSRLSYFHLIPIGIAFILQFTPLLMDQIVSMVLILLYGFLTFKQLGRESRQRGIEWLGNPGSRLSWFRNFIGINLLGLIVIATGLTGVNLIAGLFLLVLFFTVAQIFRESEFFTPIPMGTKYQKSTLTPEIKAAVLDKIEGVMEDEFYLRDDASLTNLANELGVTSHHLSQVLNESLKTSFQDLIARYRIRRACQILRDEQQDQVKIESVAAMVGYNSKSSFNAAFKKRTGLTPTVYREAKNVRTYGEAHLSERERQPYQLQKFSLNHVFNIKMNKDMIRISLRNLRKNKLHSALNIMGFALGLSACLTIAAYVHYELSYDKHHPDPENTYRLALNRIYPNYNKEWAITAPIMPPTITNDLPEVENYTRVAWDDITMGRADEMMEEQRLTAVDSGFFEVFNAEILNGEVLNDFFKKNDGIILTESAATKFFGNENPVGQLFNLKLPNDEKRLVSVAAVISDPLPNSHFSYEVLGTFEMLKFPDFVMNIWGMWAVYSYIKVHPDTDAQILTEKINAVAEEYQSAGADDWEEWKSAGNSYTYFLQPLTSIHLHSNLAEEFEANSSETFVYFFALVGLFILIMALVNFVNLATARASYRTLEVGVRKAVGATRMDLIVQFLIESTVISFIALIVALPLTQLFIPQFNQIIGKSISMELFFSPLGLLVLFISPFVLGILSGFYPALYLSNFGPAAIFQKMILKRGKQSLRHLLVIGQFIIAVVLITGTITVFRQMHFLSNKPLGFDKDQLIMVDRLPFTGEKIETFKEEFKKIAGVKGISTFSFPLDGIREGSTIRPENNPDGWVNTTTLSVDENFLLTTGIRLAAGRNFRPNEVDTRDGIEKIILNASAAQTLGWTPEEAINQPVYVTNEEYRLVIGVAEDFNFSSLRRPTEPFQLSGYEFAMPTRAAAIRIDPRKIKETVGLMEKAWANIAPDQVFEYEFVDQAMAQYYEAERLTGKLFIIFSGLGIVICCLGLFGLMGYVVEQRSKEVGIRKVMGARIRHIVLLLSKDYIRLVIISSLIAIPIAWWGFNKWLESFAFRIENSAWILIIGSLLVTLISWLTVALYAFQAAKSNPVNALRSE